MIVPSNNLEDFGLWIIVFALVYGKEETWTAIITKNDD